MVKVAKVMGVINITPDSLYGRVTCLDAIVSRAHQMVKEGADYLDIGGESTRPFSQPVSLSEECDRVIPVIQRLAKEINIPLSIDTRHPEIMEEAVRAGASIINDVQALEAPGALEVAARLQPKVCLMHMQNKPQTMQLNPQYEDVIQEIYDYLVQRIDACQAAGIAKSNIWIDPGFGFGKTLTHNLTLIGKLSRFKTLGCPILVGLSRKSMFETLLGVPVEERLAGSLAGAILSVLQGAVIVRTHDVRPTRECLTVVEAVMPYWREEQHGVNA